LIDFRYHIVSLVAVFLALALGLFLGSTSLQSTVTNNLHKQANRVTAENHTDERNEALAKAALGQEQGLVAAAEPYLITGQLSGETVALVSAPGVDGGARSDLSNALTAAGATITADVRLQSTFLDPAQDVELGELAKELSHGRGLPRTNGATQAAFELSRSLVARPSAQPSSASRIDLTLRTLSAGKMLSVAGQSPVRQATLAVLLVPAPSTSTTTVVATRQDALLIALAEQLRAAASGVVVAGPTEKPGSLPSPLKAARQDPTLPKTVSTVDADDQPAGQIATVLALAAAPTGTVGSFGLLGSPPLPSPSSTP
jgi:hypothetical protein